ncbi:MAG: RNA polymerase sigma-70 factor (ECF subfamily) [Polyangiales bacterium]
MSSGQGRLETLFAEHGRFVFRVARRLGAPARDVEDVTQEVFVVAFRKLNDFDGASPRGWLFRITSRVVRDYRKRASTRNEDLAAPLPEECSSGSQDEDIWKRQMRRALDEAMNELKPAEREIFTLYQLEKLSMRECVELIGCPEQTGYSRLKSAREKVRRKLSTRLSLVAPLEEVS